MTGKRYSLDTFYTSPEWRSLRQIVISDRTREDGFVYDEVTGRPIVQAYDIVLHHKIFLTEENVGDASIALNPDNLMVVSHRTHNQIHEKFGYVKREIYLVYGCPLSGKSSWVEGVHRPGDLVVDIDSIWQAVSGLERYKKPPALNAVVFAVRDNLMESVKMRRGRWQNAYIIGGYPLISERERLIRQLGARPVFISTGKEECMRRLEQDSSRDRAEWSKYIDDWWRKYSPRGAS